MVVKRELVFCFTCYTSSILSSLEMLAGYGRSESLWPEAPEALVVKVTAAGDCKPHVRNINTCKPQKVESRGHSTLASLCNF